MGWNKNTVVHDTTTSGFVKQGTPVPYYIYNGNGLNDQHGIGAYVLCYQELENGTKAVDVVHQHPDCDCDDVIAAVVVPQQVCAIAAVCTVNDPEYGTPKAPAKVRLEPLSSVFVVKNLKRSDKARFMHFTKEAAQSELTRLASKFRVPANDFSIIELSAAQLGGLIVRGQFLGV